MANAQLGATPGGVEIATTPGGGTSGGGIVSITSTGGTITVTNPAGPVTNIEVTNGGITQLTGDVTAGPGSGSQVATIAADAVTNAKLANVATATFKGRTTAGTGDPEDLTVAQAKTLLNLAGTNTGDQTITLTGDVTGSGTGSFAATIANDAVTNAKAANMATQTIKGRTTASTGDPEDLTAVQAAEIMRSEVPTAGSNLTDANATITIAGGADYALPAATLSANRVLTLGVTGSPITGEVISVRRQDATANTYTINDDAATALIVLPASTKFAAYFRFDGTHFVLSGAIRIQ